MKNQSPGIMKTLSVLFMICGLQFFQIRLFAQYTLNYQTNGSVITLTGYTGTPVNLTISNFVTAIGNEAFRACYSLTNITIPESVTTIGNLAFWECLGLTDVSIPASVTSIGEAPFLQCVFLTNISVNPQSLNYSSSNGVLFDKNQLTLIQYPGGNTTTTYAIPSSVTSIGVGAFFYCQDLNAVTIPGSITSMGEEAFEECFNLTNITISNGVTTIGQQAFQDCINLSSVIIPGSVNTIGFSAFMSCSGLTNITLDKGIYDIGEQAFLGCTAVSSVGIPDSVAIIEEYAFYGCTNLSNIVISNGVISIGDAAFAGCELATVTVPSSATNIGEAPFSCPGLTNISVVTPNPDYESVNGVLFNQNQTTLVEYPIGLNAPSYAIPAGVTNIGGSAFSGDIYLANVTIPNSVVAIGDAAFFGCSLLNNITLPGGIVSLGPSAFMNSGLTNVAIPDSVTDIEDEAFSDCSNLASVEFGDGVTNIGYGTFQFCVDLSSVTIPSSVTEIDDYAFADCSNLASVYFAGDAPDADCTIFSDDTATIFYLSATTGWNVSPITDCYTSATWSPLIQAGSSTFGILNKQFGFTITGPIDTTVIVKACTNLANAIWVPLQTNIITNGSIQFRDPGASNYPSRFYTVQFP